MAEAYALHYKQFRKTGSKSCSLTAPETGRNGRLGAGFVCLVLWTWVRQFPSLKKTLFYFGGRWFTLERQRAQLIMHCQE